MEALKLINAPFTFEFNDTKYEVKRANIEKVILFQTRFSELADKNDPAIEQKMAGYCIFLALKDVKTDVTEEWVNQNTPGDVVAADIIEHLGFMSRQKVEVLRRVLLQRNAPATESKTQ